MFQLQPVHTQTGNAQHCDGLEAADSCAWGSEALDCCKNPVSQSTLCCSASVV